VIHVDRLTKIKRLWARIVRQDAIGHAQKKKLSAQGLVGPDGNQQQRETP
jgi:hypothetical protein